MSNIPKNGIIPNHWGNFPNQNNFNKPSITYNDTQIIQTTKLNAGNKIPYRVFIQARDRDTLKYPNPNYFSVNLPDEYRDVISINLKNCKIPVGLANVRDSNNLFYFQETPESFQVVKIPFGNYFSSNLATMLQNEINAVSLANITVSIKSNDGGLSNFFYFKTDFSGGAQYFRILTFNPSCLPGNSPETYIFDQKININTLEPLPNTIYQTLGFERFDYLFLGGKMTGYTGENRLYTNNYCINNIYSVGDFIKFQNPIDSTIYTITNIIDDTTVEVNPPLAMDHIADIVYLDHFLANFKFNFINNEYIILRIEEIPYIRTTSPFLKNFYQVIHDLSSYLDAAFISITDGFDIRYFNPPIPRLSKLTFEFVSPNGDRYSFQDDQIFLDFEIVCANSPPSLSTNDTFSY